MSVPRNMWNWLRRQIVADVPEGEALCEFDCRKPQCTEEEWEVCDRRLKRAAGELMPEEKPRPTDPATEPTTKESEKPMPKG